MLKILIYSTDGNGLFCIDRLQREGHLVTLYEASDEAPEDYDGLVDKIDSIEGIDEDTDVIFVDDVGKGKEVDKLIKAGFLVIGGSSFHDKLEEDRQFGIDVMKKCNINIPETFDFTSLDKAINFVQKNPDRYVIKVNDSAAKYTSHVGKDAEDLVKVMTHMKDEGLIKESAGFILQKFVEGYEISIEGWFNGTEFIPGMFNHCIEQKKYLVGDLGPTTGSQGAVVFGGKNVSPMLRDNIMKLESSLAKNHYLGAIDLNTIVDKKGQPWALEFCARVGYVSLENLLDLFDGDFGEFLYDCANGEGLEYELSDDICVGVTLTVPPYPIELEEDLPEDKHKEIMDILGKRCLNMEVSGIDKFRDHCYFSLIKMDEEGKLRISSSVGYLGAICGRAKSVDLAQKLVYDRLKEVDLPAKQYRIDIGDRAKEWFKESGRVVEKKKLSEDIDIVEGNHICNVPRGSNRRFSRERTL